MKDSIEQQNRFDRVSKLREKYLQRNGLFPVVFTGSFDDLIVVANAGERATGFLSPGGIASSLYSTDETRYERAGGGAEMISWRTRNLDTFSNAELDAWMRLFQEYWLNLLETLRILSGRHTDGLLNSIPERNEVSSFNEMEDELDESSTESNNSTNSPLVYRPRPQNKAFLGLRFEVCASIFENDLLLDNTKNNCRLRQNSATRLEIELANRVRQRISFENRYLSHRVLDEAISDENNESRNE